MLKLLKGETRLMDSLPIGQHLLTFQNIPLMFLKKIEGVLMLTTLSFMVYKNEH